MAPGYDRGDPGAGMVRAFVLACVLAVAMTPGAAHARDWKIHYETGSQAPGNGIVLAAIQFKDERPEKRGRGENDRVGVVRAGAGFPYPLKTEGLPIDALLVAWVTDALHAEGYSPGTAGPAMTVVAEDFWIDGYMAYTLQVKVRLEVAGTGGTAWTWRFEDQATESLEWSYSEFDKPLAAILGRQGSALRAALKSDAFRAAVGAPVAVPPTSEAPATVDAPLAIPADGAPAPAAAESTAATGGCGKDTDCKGERICHQRKCIDP
jgi:hypothetical protein